MKLKTLIAATTLVALSHSAMAADTVIVSPGEATATAVTDTATVNFSGGFLTSTCKINFTEGATTTNVAGAGLVSAGQQWGHWLDGTTAEGVEGSATVGLGIWPVDTLKTATTTTLNATPAQFFNVEFTECNDTLGGANVQFTGTASDFSASLLHSSVSDNVGIGIFEGATAPTEMSQYLLNSVEVANVEFTDNAAVLELGAQFVANGADPAITADVMEDGSTAATLVVSYYGVTN